MSICFLGACDSGFKIGSWTVIKPRAPLNADRIEITRRTVVGDDAHGDQARMLSVDLDSGDASLTDFDGLAYALQLDGELTARLKAGMANRSWMIGRRRQPRGSHVRAYELSVFVMGEPVDHSVIWHAPPSKPVPPSLKDVESAFDAALRHVYPISDTVNLIEWP